MQNGMILYDGSSSDSFPVKSGVKKGCVLAPTLFAMFVSLLLSTDGVYLHTISDGKLFNLTRLRSRTKVRSIPLREMLFADDAALAAHRERALQRLSGHFDHACCQFGLSISLKKTCVSVQDTDIVPAFKMGGVSLEVVEKFAYLGSTITRTLSLDIEIDQRIGKANTTMAKLTTRVWENKTLTEQTASIKPVFTASYCMVARPGSHTNARNAG
ncbi:hypothetical protein Bbelb_377440 [Branchiostoma belcheri]|nr:hypothetical protein Bbelb_377440 [Branchiostoma belcheri]